jgi:uncharacterized protein YndB with AHSA1/START domain
MPVTDITKDAERLTMVVTSEFDAPLERVWELWADPRLLERWWGPPGWPATFTAHSLEPGGRCRYHMTGPDGEQFHSIWMVLEVDAMKRIAWTDMFTDAAGEVDSSMPVIHAEVTFEDLGERHTKMVATSSWESAEAMARMLEMGMEEGMRAAIGQIDPLLN